MATAGDIGPAAAVVQRFSSSRRKLLLKRLAGARISGHELCARTLSRLGITHVYAVSGTPIHETLAACSRLGVRPIGVRHQQAGVMAAAAQNFVAGSLRAAAVLSAGPAITNAATGVLLAHENAWPLLVLGGRRPVRATGTGVFQDLDAIPLMRPMTKEADRVTTTGAIAESIVRAAATASNGRPGPVYLDLDEEALKGTAIEPEDVVATLLPQPGPTPRDLDRAAELLRRARRPVVLFGRGVRWEDAHEELRVLVEALRIPFVASPMGRGLIPDDHSLCFSAIAGSVQADADVALIVGGRLNWQFRFGSQLSSATQLIVVDIDTAELGRLPRPALRLAGRARQVLRELLNRIHSATEAPIEQRQAHLEDLQKRRTAAQTKLESLAAADGAVLSPYRVMQELRELLPADAITVLDGHLAMLAAQQMIPCRQPLGRITAGTNGTMGSGLPFALGAKLNCPDRLTVAICGDSAFGFNAMELETAVRHRIPVVVVVIDNQGIWGAHVHRANYPSDHERVAMYSAEVRYDRLATALGAHGEYVETAAQIRPAFERAIAAGAAACIHIRTDPFGPVPPLINY